MDHSVFQVFRCELFAWRSNVALFIPIAFNDAFDWSGKHIASDIKFSFIVKKGHKILLNDRTSIFASWTFGPDHFGDLFYRIADLYPTSLVRVFPRLNNPKWVWCFILLFLLYFFERMFFFIFKYVFELIPSSISVLFDMKG